MLQSGSTIADDADLSLFHLINAVISRLQIECVVFRLMNGNLIIFDVY